MTRQELQTDEEDVIMVMDSDNYTEERDYAFFGNETGYVMFLAFEEGKGKYLRNSE